MLGLAVSVAKGGASLLTYVKDNLKLYLDFKSNRSDTLAFPSGGSTSFDSGEQISFSKITLTDAFTVGFWFKGDTQSDYKLILKDSTPGSSNDILVKDHNGQVTIRINGAYKAIISNTPHNTWCHIVFARDVNGNIKTYLNAIASGTHTSTHTFALDTIGYSSAGAIFNMANLGIWSRALSPEEVQSVMNKSYSQLGSVEKTSLEMWQSLDSVDATGRMDTPAIGTGAITTSFPTNIYLNSHGTTEYTEVMANNGSLATQGAWTFHSGGTDSAFADTGIYSEGALKIKNVVVAKVAINGINASVLEPLIANQLYKLEITYTRVDGQHAQQIALGVGSSYGFADSDVKWKEGYWSGSDGSASEKTITGYFFHATGKNYLWIRSASTSVELHFKTISLKKVTNNAGGGGISISNNNNHYDATLTQGATTTTSVYGNNSPVLPRAIDIAESQADAIGNGSASFNGSSDYIDLGDSTDFDITNSITLSAWIKADAINQHALLVGRDDGTNRNYYFDLYTDEKIFWNCKGLSDTQVGSSTIISANEWYHIAGTYDGSNLKLYINGILEDSDASTGSIDNDNVSLTIGAREAGMDRRFNGSISQVGIWQGALTQAQIQSVMESTSYAKIPADVKSTLGSNVLTHDFSDGSGVTLNSYPSSDITFNGKMVFDGASSGTTNYPSLSHSGYSWNTSDLIKVTIVCSSYTSGSISHQGGSALTSVRFGIDSSNGVGTHTWYFVSDGAGNFQFRAINPVMTIDSITAQVVTNDIVAYYPLDADSSANGVTQDVTTGETSEERVTNTDFTTTDVWSLAPTETGNRWAIDISAGTVTHNGSGGFSPYLSQNNVFDDASAIYKMTITIDSCENFLHAGIVRNGTVVNFYHGFGITSTGTHIVYINGNTSSALSVYSNGVVTVISHLSIKKITSNTGVLK